MTTNNISTEPKSPLLYKSQNTDFMSYLKNLIELCMIDKENGELIAFGLCSANLCFLFVYLFYFFPDFG
jgi:hypothetical protein